jgi:hypothetical protein
MLLDVLHVQLAHISLLLAHHFVLRVLLAYPQQVQPQEAHPSLLVESVLLAMQALLQIQAQQLHLVAQGVLLVATHLQAQHLVHYVLLVAIHLYLGHPLVPLAQRASTQQTLSQEAHLSLFVQSVHLDIQAQSQIQVQ